MKCLCLQNINVKISIEKKWVYEVCNILEHFPFDLYMGTTKRVCIVILSFCNVKQT